MFDTLLGMLAQRSFEELGTPLAEVTFCVVDLETTGGSPGADEITEIGAVKVRMGEVVGTMDTLVKPARPIPAFIRILTGITDEIVAEAPRIDEVLPAFLEFAGGCVLVAHNARFDVGFLNAALVERDYEPLTNRVLDTALLARRILSGEVPNNRLETLARHLRCAHRPCHRAHADVLATIDVLHHLIERVAGYGVVTLEDLLAMSATKMDGSFGKIKLTEGLPKAQGIYRFLGGKGETLYVGKATDLRARVRSYFYGDPRRRIRDLLRQTQEVTFETFPTMLEAEVAEVRAITREMPPHNRAGKRRATWYVKVGKDKISPTRVPKDDGRVYLGPLPSIKHARLLIDALRDAAAIHRCADPRKCGGCAFAELGRCSGTDRERHVEEVALVERALRGDSTPIFEQLAARMKRLARQERYEEAAELRDRAAALQRALERHAEVRALLDAGCVRLRVGEVHRAVTSGRLGEAPEAPCSFVPSDVYSEARVILSWLKRHADDVELQGVSGTWAMSARRPSFRFEVERSGVGDRDQGLERASRSSRADRVAR